MIEDRAIRVCAAVLLCALAGGALAGCASGIAQTAAISEPPAPAPAPGQPQGYQVASANPVQMPQAGRPGRPGQPVACTVTQFSVAVPPVPNKFASAAGAVAENAGRNVVRNVGTNIVANQVAGLIPGIGGVVAVAATQTAGKEIVRTAEDVRGTWTATDGAPHCGCRLELSRSGMIITDNIVAPKGCVSPTLASAARWKVVDSGYASQDLLLLAADNATVLARFDRKGVDYFQGPVGPDVITVWR